MRRRFVVGFLAVFVVVALAEANAWPLTGWQLFSRVRGPTQAGWEAWVFDAEGLEWPVAYPGTLHVLQGFPDASAERRRAACAAWVQEFRETGIDAVGVRVYRTRSTVSLKVSPPATWTTREPQYTC